MPEPSPCPTPPGPALDLSGLLDDLTGTPGRADSLAHLSVLPPRAGRPAPWPAWVHPELRRALGERGVHAPWTHQAEAAQAARDGRHVVVSTGTASGKSLAYLLPAITDILERRGSKGQRGASVLYIAPTKALAQDQLAAVRSLGVGVRVTSHDGDSPREQREWARDHGEYLLTNPDMLHRSLLPGHQRWDAYFRRLRFVVVDECHHYKGVFGAHVAQVLRRLLRVAQVHGATPTVILASATVAEPARTAAALTGVDRVLAVTEDGSPRGRVALALWEPATIGAGAPALAAVADQPRRRGVQAEVAELLADLTLRGVRTLAFVRSRRGVEQVAVDAAALVREADPALADRIAAYRGGHLPEERREVERRLRDGDLVGLAATNALELGIDISGLDAVVLAGYPGTRAAFWQQLGRAGRGAGDALGMMVARNDPLDRYLLEHPDTLLGEPVEATVFDTDNEHVLAPHLCAAAHEQPLTVDDLPRFGPQARAVVDDLTADGLLRRRPRGWFWTDHSHPGDLADLRSTGGRTVALLEQDTGRIISSIDVERAHTSAHRGAVYLHLGQTWVVAELDLDDNVAVLRREDPGYDTSVRQVSSTEIMHTAAQRRLGAAVLAHGDVDVTSQVTSYLRRRRGGPPDRGDGRPWVGGTGALLGEEPLDLPARTMSTRAVWWSLPDEAMAEAGLGEKRRPGAAHAAEHAAIGLLPIFATCDRWDLGGLSTGWHPQTEQLTVFVHDATPGGAGFAERGYTAATQWLRATRDTIASCACSDGCPACIQSPKCGNQNNPLDKDGAVILLDLLLIGSR